MDYVVDKYGKGTIRSFVGVPETVVDVVRPSFKLLYILHFLNLISINYEFK